MSQADMEIQEFSSHTIYGSSRIPYQLPQPWGMRDEMAFHNTEADDDRFWAQLAPGIYSRPLHLNVTQGYYTHLMKVKRTGVLQRHRHSGPVHAYVLKGSWYYLEHEWVARQGSYIFEPPGETHTLTVPEDCDEMLTLFTVFGALIFVDPEGNAEGYDDVFTRIETYRQHFETCGLGSGYVGKFIR